MCRRQHHGTLIGSGTPARRARAGERLVDLRADQRRRIQRAFVEIIAGAPKHLCVDAPQGRLLEPVPCARPDRRPVLITGRCVESRLERTGLREHAMFAIHHPYSCSGTAELLQREVDLGFGDDDRRQNPGIIRAGRPHHRGGFAAVRIIDAGCEQPQARSNHGERHAQLHHVALARRAPERFHPRLDDGIVPGRAIPGHAHSLHAARPSRVR